MDAVQLSNANGHWPRLWQGRWIWSSEQVPPPLPMPFDIGAPQPPTWNRFCYLRRSFDVSELPATCPARVTADSRYVLYLNGVEVSRGPARSAPPRLCFDEVDLAPHLREGENVLAAVVRFYGRPVPWWRPFGRSGQLGYGSFCFEAPTVGVVSDSSWRGRTAPYAQDAPIPPIQPATEVLDGEQIPAGWQEAGFDDAGW